MSGLTRQSSLAIAIFVASLASAGAGASGQLAPQQATPAPNAPKMTQQVFKNIEVLEDVPADQLIPAMQFISASLGVDCEFCHVKGAFDKDDKENKQTARKMMKMMFAIDKDNFGGKKMVTCYSCHRGSPEPVGIPIISATELAPEAAHAPEEAAAPNALPKADDLIAKYVEALGGKDAIDRISSRVEKGTLAAMGNDSPVEVFAKSPDKRISIAHLQGGEIVTAFDGEMGWLGNPGRPAREMSSAEADGARLDADLHFATDLTQLFKGFRVRPAEKIGDSDAWVVYGLNEDKPPVVLYFHEKSGLLVRMVRYVETPLGRNPTQIDYADYRDVNGVKVPFRWTIARPGGRFTIQIEKIQQNVPVDDAKFAMPPAPPAPPEEKKP
ncbi:MAG: c-type cytochrome [Candidatus Acidiferrales bacterium]